MLRLPMFMLALVCASVAIDKPPVISLDLSGATSRGGIHRWNPLYHGNHPAIAKHKTYAKHCPVLTSNAATCAEPRATAMDHHDGNLDIKKVVKLLVASKPREEPQHVNKVEKDVNYNLRGEYLLEYDAEDQSGNRAEQVTFAMVIIGAYLVTSSHSIPQIISRFPFLVDHVPPSINPALPNGYHIQAADPDQLHIDRDDRRYFILPKTTTAVDNYDGTVSSRLKVTVTHSKDGVFRGDDIRPTPLITTESEIRMDTLKLGVQYVKYTVTDYANIFGLYNKDNTADITTTVFVEDTIAPVIYCNPHGFESGSGHFSDPNNLISSVKMFSIEQCSEACFKQQWTRRVGSKKQEDKCEYFEYNDVSKMCKLYNEEASQYFNKLHAVKRFNQPQGRLNQCEDVMTVECGHEHFHDPGAICIDMRDSYKNKAIESAALAVHTLQNVDDSKVGGYEILYKCTDEAGNAAGTKTRSVQVADTEKPQIELLGLHTEQIICGATDNEKILSKLRTYGSGGGYQSHDRCPSSRRHRCRVEMYEETCGGEYLCDNGLLCDGRKRSILPPNDALEAGTWAFKYTCTDAGFNTASVCRTVLTVDSKLCIEKRKSETSPPSLAPTAAPGVHRPITMAPTGLPMDCMLNPWGEWDSCTEPCGGGIQQRSRTILQPALNGGKPCKALVEKRQCNVAACPRDCLHDWLGWTGCSQSCGGGIQHREIDVIITATNGGRACPLAQQRVCNSFPCAEDCVTSTWSAWSECTRTCGMGTQYRTVKIVQTPRHGGIACPPLQERRACSTFDCAVDCKVSDWSTWSTCSQVCGFGIKSRARQVLTRDTEGGIPCPPTHEVADCKTVACPSTCENHFSDWTQCTKSCGGGVQVRSVKNFDAVKMGGDCPYAQERTCQPQSCPIDCVVSRWSDWSGCSVSCGGGEKMRTRKTILSAQYGGESCPPLEDQGECNVQACEDDCQVTEWYSWSECSAECGGGIRSRVRYVLREASRAGKPCPLTEQYESCNPRPCPVHCQYIFSDWTACSASCAGGIQKRTMEITAHAQYGGNQCPSADLQHRVCNEQRCPVSCVVTAWRGWSACSKSCGTGSKSRSRAIVVAPAFGGHECPTLVDERPCASAGCPQPCKLSAWSEYGACSQQCGHGVEVRRRQIIHGSEHGGLPCAELEEMRNCKVQECPAGCLSRFGAWSQCRVSCGKGGVQHRSVAGDMIAPMDRRLLQLACPTSEQRICNQVECPLDCILSLWSEWSSCSRTCGKGKKFRTRQILRREASGGMACPVTEETLQCHLVPCAIDCKVSEWQKWSACSQPCGSGIRMRERQVVTLNAHGGLPCPTLEHIENCDAGSCPVHCKVDYTQPWKACSVTCGNGLQTRPLADSKHVGDGCPIAEERVCNSNPCPLDCLVSLWGQWEDCTKSCGKGNQLRYRTIIRRGGAGGKPCPPLTEMASCAAQPCPVDCVVSSWGNFDECTRTCGTGSRIRTRKIETKPLHGGQWCPPLTESEKCAQTTCPINCVVSEWGVWGSCSQNCGGGIQTRSRDVVVFNAFGGAYCPELSETRGCDNDVCPSTCATTYSSWSPCTRTCGGGTQTRKPLQVNPGCPPYDERVCNTDRCPVHCVVTEWSEWGACSATCGGGVRSQSRKIVVGPLFGGEPCPSLKHTSACNTKPCPVDCVMSQWNEWDTCSSTCGVGFQTRHRRILQPEMSGGKPCGALVEKQACNTLVCPENCAVSVWTEWSSCSQVCGGGLQSRSRVVTNTQSHGGMPCPDLETFRACNEAGCPKACEYSAWSACSTSCGPGKQSRTVVVSDDTKDERCPASNERVCHAGVCPVNCVTGQWGLWSECSKKCGGGMQERHRDVVIQDSHGGKPCGDLIDIAKCNLAACPVDCRVGKWLDWQPCTVTCGGGTQTRERKLVAQAAYGGQKCPPLSQIEECGAQPCPINCQASAWGEWDSCSQHCGGGVQIRRRSEIHPGTVGGLSCPPMQDSRSCNTKTCSSDCEHMYGDWTPCSKTCGLGSQSRPVLITKLASGGGSPCPSSQERVCATTPCPIDCVLSGWSDWSPCSVTCGSGGKRSRHRVVKRPAAFNGESCGELGQQQECMLHYCPEDCRVSPWSEWTACPKGCGTATQRRSRTLLTYNAYDGKPCPPLSETRQCNTVPCPLDCVYEYNFWSDCSQSCGTGTQVRKFLVAQHGAHGGVECSTEQDRLCAMDPCPVDCVVAEWGDWSACTVTCGSGSRHRYRDAKVMPEHGGKACPQEAETETCNAQACPVDCKVGNWLEWGSCSEPCGMGVQFRSRVVVVTNSTGGVPCPVLRDSRGCNTEPCSVDCQFEYGAWKPCSQTCGTGVRSRVAKVIAHPAHGGKACPTSEEQVCNMVPCAVDCIASEFGDWSACSKVCEGGLQERTRLVLRNPEYGGKKCPTLRETQQCNTQPCTRDCSMSEWQDWSHCSQDCGGGYQFRMRDVLVSNAYGGTTCPPTNETRACQTAPCPVHCEYSATWEACSRTCGYGVQKRRIDVTREAANGGKQCPPEEDRSCNTKPCPVACVVTVWGSWNDCSKECGGGSQTKTRFVSNPALFGGLPCPELEAIHACNTDPCPNDCQVGSWSAWSACSATCNGGQMSRSRSVYAKPLHGGASCPWLHDIKACGTAECPVDCVASEWDAWTPCPRHCGGNIQTRSRSVITKAQHGGQECAELVLTRDCPYEPCPPSCDDAYAPWSACSASCGLGAQKRALKAGVADTSKCVAVEERTCNEQPCPVDCVLSPFSPWQPCSKTCGFGFQHRVRAVVVPPGEGGLGCPALEEDARCTNGECPSDCVVSSWSGWASCSSECGGGLRMRLRTVIRMAGHGGRGCPVLEQAEACNVQPCSIDCEITPWGNWDGCSQPCGGGVMNRQRFILVGASNGGKACPYTKELRDCNTEPCPVDCQYEWGEWNACTRTCGNGAQMRSVKPIQASAYGGRTCPTMQERTCNVHQCPTDCTVSKWSVWSTCTTTCGSGVQKRRRDVDAESSHGGKHCPATIETRSCATGLCPLDCEVSAWTQWSDCSQSCNGGVQHRSRSVAAAGAHAGAPCPALAERRNCHTAACPSDCVYKYEPWSECSKSCGTGIQRRRAIIISSSGSPTNHAHCPAFEERVCGVRPCPVDCVLSAWSEPSPCSKTCGYGVFTRTRTVIVGALHAGRPCGAMEESIHCNTKPCPVDCVMGAWTAWTPCTATCGNSGTQTRQRTITREPAAGGLQCPALIVRGKCNISPCPVPCEVSQWSMWGPCSAECGDGVKHRDRSVAAHPAHGGHVCPPLSEMKDCGHVRCPTTCPTDFTDWSACSASCGTGMQHRKPLLTALEVPNPNCPKQVHRVCNTHDCPTDCILSEWGVWSACSMTCGGGVKSRRRKAVVHPSDGGALCASLFEHQVCNIVVCPVDCVMTEWDEFSPCSATCGRASQVRTRSIMRIDGFGGVPCGSLIETRNCHLKECPVDCVVSSWRDWTVCTKTCGGGERTRKRKIVTENSADGAVCPELFDHAECGVQACPVDCQTSDWGEWSTCTAECGHGVQLRSRYVQVKASGGGVPCADLEQHRVCNAKACPLICTTVWKPWSSCTQSCGGGLQKRFATADLKQEGCPASQQRLCNEHPCPVDCVSAQWSDWSSCSATCAAGSQTRYRKVSQPAKHGGRDCLESVQTRRCSVQACPIDCAMSEWAPWSGCSATCGGGTMYRKRWEVVKAEFGGVACGALSEMVPCHLEQCPFDCVVGQWEEWSECSVSCGFGYRHRFRHVATSAFGGRSCPALRETRECDAGLCAADCKVSEWSEWSECSERCGGGIHQRARMIVAPRLATGKECPALTDIRDCNTRPCPVDCKSTWLEWGACSRTCGGGVQNRPLEVVQAAAHGGKDCPSSMERVCNADPCPGDCVVSPWGAWSMCTQTCGSGVQHASRKVILHPEAGGAACPVLTREATCAADSCPINCAVSRWSEWAPCSLTCGSGEHRRYRAVVTPPKFNGGACPVLIEARGCNFIPCPVDCAVSPFGEWGLCSKTCDGGFQRRFRKILVEPQNNGAPCPDMHEHQKCNIQKCPVDCVVGEYTDWSPCSQECNDGIQKRKRTITVHPSDDGKPCPVLNGVRLCNTQACPTHCEFTYGAWAACSKTCGGGVQSRTMEIVNKASDGGKACPTNTMQYRPCSTGPCPINCIVTHWHSWGACSVTCGVGKQTRSRTVTHAPSRDGVQCPHLTETAPCHGGECPVNCEVGDWRQFMPCSQPCGGGLRPCNMHSCGVDCQVGEWEDWLPCSQRCGGGVQERSRIVTIKPHHGGIDCPPLHETRVCHTDPCPADCEDAQWSEWSACSESCGGGRESRKATVPSADASCPTAQERLCATKPCPIDCMVSSWSSWDGCTKSCGTGSQTRTRRVLRSPTDGGRACPPSAQDRDCNIKSCPVNCEVSEWQDWTPCSLKCGGGVSERARRVLMKNSQGGIPCPELMQRRNCNAQPCDHTCSGEWYDWGACSASCGAGVQVRTQRSLAATSTGVICPTRQQRVCNTKPCALNCVVSEWSDWSICTKTCGFGFQVRHRSVVMDAAFNGKPCPALLMREVCNAHACPIDCVVAEWGGWNECSEVCGSGVRNRRRYAVVIPANGGTPCPALTDVQNCNTQACPAECTFDEGAWSPCTTSCGTGSQTRELVIVTEAPPDQVACPSARSRVCNTKPCPVDCIVGRWSEWSSCTKTCSGGSRTRTRLLTVHSVHGGKKCPPLQESQACNTMDCAVDCAVSSWNAWGSCSQTCGNGVQTRHRSILIVPESGGTPCPALGERRNCDVQPCPLDCEVSSWQTWTSCSSRLFEGSAKCGAGVQKRARKVLQPALFHGSPCPFLTQVQDCQVLCPVDCSKQHWGQWTECSTTCGPSGTQNRKVVALISALPGCPTFETRTCNAMPCPRDCEVTSWSEYGVCSSSCNGGTQSRKRHIVVMAAPGGQPCPKLDETKKCNTQTCPIDCVVTDFGEWRDCSKPCGTGTHSRARTVVTEPENGGRVCPALVATQLCNTLPCPVDCVVSEWDSWTACSEECDGGVQGRKREVVIAAQHNGKPCPPVEEERNCNIHGCPVDCVFEFDGWTPCSKSCGTGTQTRPVRVLSHRRFAGAKCPLSEERICGTVVCPVDCHLGSWTGWGKCSKSCGTGSMTRSREVQVSPQFGGAQCAPATQAFRCNTHPCGVHCAVSKWSAWGDCSEKVCGNGVRTRFRSVSNKPAHGGIPCPALSEAELCSPKPCPAQCEGMAWADWTPCSVPCGTGTTSRTPVHALSGCPTEQWDLCNKQPCPTDCVASSWGLWGLCTKICGGGVTTRKRVIFREPAMGGAACPPLADERLCAEAPCPVDCAVGAWDNWNQCSSHCGGGLQYRNREVVTGAAHAGKACPVTKEWRACGMIECPAECDVKFEWSTWTACTKSCGQGMQKRQLRIPASHDGLTVVDKGRCEDIGYLTITSPSICQEAGAKHAAFARKKFLWEEPRVAPVVLTSCTFRDDRLSMTFTPSTKGGECGVDGNHCLCIGQDPAIADCPKEQSRFCNSQACATDCEVSVWQRWSECTKTCGPAAQVRHRRVTAPAVGEGKKCPELTEMQSCSNPDCPVDCQVTAWGEWGKCSQACGSGIHRRKRSVLLPFAGGGLPCPSLEEVSDCGMQPCDPRCYNEWMAWTPCSKTCGEGVQTRPVLDIMKAEEVLKKLGTETPAGKCTLLEQRTCSAGPCPVDCQVSTWSAYGACTTTCGEGAMRRSRRIVFSPNHGGRLCPTLAQTTKCDNAMCPRDCEVSPWHSWSECDKTCGSGSKLRRRTVYRDQAYGGRACPPLHETRKCNTGDCPVDCEVSAWAQWAQCSQPCGGGISRRSRRPLVDSTAGGKPCSVLFEQRNCNVHQCPTHCEHEFLPWSACSRSCGSGTQHRAIVVLQEPARGGKDCPSAQERVCNSNACPTPPPTPAVVTKLPTFAPTAYPTSKPPVPRPVVDIFASDFVMIEAARGLFYSDRGASCKDEHNTDLSFHVHVSGAIFPSGARLGTYAIDYDCTAEKTGVAAITATKTVVVRDTTCPVCTVKPGPKTIETSFPYLDAGVECSDSLDGKLENLVITNPVDVEEEGTYYVTYRARDAAGNWNDGACKGSATYVRTVTVVDTLKPVVALHYNGKIVSQSRADDVGANGEKNPAAMYGSRLTEEGTTARNAHSTTMYLVAAVASAGVAIALASFSRSGRRSKETPPSLSRLV